MCEVRVDENDVVHVVDGGREIARADVRDQSSLIPNEDEPRELNFDHAEAA